MNFWRTAYDHIIDFLIPLSPEEEQALTASGEVLATKMHPQILVFQDINITALFSYKDPVIRNLIWLFKYKRNTRAINTLAHILAEFLLEECADQYVFGNKEKLVLVPIPLSYKRKRERGFNQMELLVRTMFKENTELFENGTDFLIKTKHTKNQTELSKKKRTENLRNVFAVPHPEKVRGKTIILIDDVVTTGSTLSEAHKTLARAEARAITCVALAH